MEALKTLCGAFTPIQLDNMNKVRLMNRKEIKYTVHRNLLPAILKRLVKSYEILEINGQNLMPYKSVYFDTRDYKLYTTHQNGKLNRYKVRSRTYELTGTEFLEIKFKNNRKRTIKSRIKLDKEGRIREATDFLKTGLPSSLQNLEQKLIVRYLRLMLVDHAKTERVTIDLNLRCSSFEKEKFYNDLVVIEIKHMGDLRNSVIAGVLSEMNIKSLSFSKYCLGISELYRDVKKNLMKIKMRKIRKALYLQNNLELT